MSAESEIEQVRRAAAGDRAAQAALVHRHMPVIFRVSYRLLQDRAEAEDVTQETFLRVWKKLSEWEPRASFSSWACTIAVNLSRDRLRKKKPILMDELPEQIDHALQPDAELASNQAVARIETQIAALPDRQREALSLCALEGMGNKEAAEAMGVTVHALEGLLGRARRSLRATLNVERDR
ncbi:MAG: sigma-70 family RNA polymerase sigma factor [Pseudomonadota bacterium]